jgi:predicted nucleic acid-binding protein
VTLKDVIAFRIVQPINYTELDLADTLEIAHQQKLTFYDVSYIVTTRHLRAAFVTDNEKLMKIANKYVKTIAYTDFERETRY